jgi:hypothetical protein
MRPTLLLALFCLTLARLSAAEPTRPNVLFITADDWGRGHAGAYGCSWVKTPNFDRVAKEGLLFLNAYTPTAKCTPSRSTILTGRHPWLLGAAANHQCVFPPEHAIFPDLLEQQGYAYASTGKVWAPGLALKADGHYLHVHTDAGCDLVIYRLSDAIRELPLESGAQVHRSWWVAARALGPARHRDHLSLVNGLEVPVSRSFRLAARQRGWLVSSER